MKKMVILTRFVKEYEPLRLKEEGVKAGLKTELVKYGWINLAVVGGKSVVELEPGEKLSSYDYFIPRAASKKGSSMTGVKTAVLEMVERDGKARVLNGVSFSKYPLLGKLEQGLVLAHSKVPTVDYVNFGSKRGWRDFEDEPFFELPVIVKGRFGSHGRTVRLINDWEEFDRVYSEYKQGEVLIQPKVKARQWYRCIVVGDEYLGEMRHRQKDKYGGESLPLTKLSKSKMERLKEVVLKACKLFKVDYAGVDVIYDEEVEDFKVLEVNRTAQFKYFEKRTGVNVAEKIIEFLVK